MAFRPDTTSGFRPDPTPEIQPVGGVTPRPEERFGIQKPPTAEETLLEKYRDMPKWGMSRFYKAAYFPLYQASHLLGGLARTHINLEKQRPGSNISTAKWLVDKFAKSKGVPKEIADKAFEEALSPAEWVPFYKSTEKVREVRLGVGEYEAKKSGFSITPTVELINAIFPLLTEVGLTRGRSRAALKAMDKAFQMKALAKAPDLLRGVIAPAARILTPSNIDNLGRAGAVGYLATEGTEEQRRHSALTIMSYSAVPMLSSGLGIPAGAWRATANLAANISVSLPYYKELIESFGGIEEALSPENRGVFASNFAAQVFLDTVFAVSAAGAKEASWKSFRQRHEVPETDFVKSIEGTKLRYDNGKLYKTQNYGGVEKEIEVTKGTRFDYGDKDYAYWGKSGDKIRIVDVRAEIESGTLKQAKAIQEEVAKWSQPLKWEKTFTQADQVRLEKALNITHLEFEALTKDLPSNIRLTEMPYMVRERLLRLLGENKDLPAEEKGDLVRRHILEVEGNSIYRLHGRPNADSAVVWYRGAPFEAKNLGKMLLGQGKDTVEGLEFKNGWDDVAIPDIKNTVLRGMQEGQRELGQMIEAKEGELFKKTLMHDEWDDPAVNAGIISAIRATVQTAFEIKDLGSDIEPGAWDAIPRNPKHIELRKVNNLTEAKAREILAEKGVKIAEPLPEGYGFYGSIAYREGPDRIVVVFDSKYIDKMYDSFSGKVKPGVPEAFQKRTFDREQIKKGLIPIHLVAQNLTKDQWRQFVLNHEIVHYLAGFAGGIADENMINAIALIRIGLPEAAEGIRQYSRDRSTLKDFFKKPGKVAPTGEGKGPIEAFGGKKKKPEIPLVAQKQVIPEEYIGKEVQLKSDVKIGGDLYGQGIVDGVTKEGFLRVRIEDSGGVKRWGYTNPDNIETTGVARSVEPGAPRYIERGIDRMINREITAEEKAEASAKLRGLFRLRDMVLEKDPAKAFKIDEEISAINEGFFRPKVKKGAGAVLSQSKGVAKYLSGKALRRSLEPEVSSKMPTDPRHLPTELIDINKIASLYRPQLHALFKKYNATTDQAEQGRIRADIEKIPGVQKVIADINKYKKELKGQFYNYEYISNAVHGLVLKAEKRRVDLKGKYERIFAKISERKYEEPESLAEIEARSRRIERYDEDLYGGPEKTMGDFTEVKRYIPEELTKALYEEAKKLSPEELNVLGRYWGIDFKADPAKPKEYVPEVIKPMSLDEIAQQWGVPREKIQETYDKAFGHIRGKFIKNPDMLIKMSLADENRRSELFAHDQGEEGIHFFNPVEMEKASKLGEYRFTMNNLLDLESQEVAFNKKASTILLQAEPKDRPELSRGFDSIRSKYKEDKALLRQDLQKYPPDVQAIVERQMRSAQKQRERREQMNSVEEGKDYQDTDINYLGGPKNKEAISKKTREYGWRLYAFRRFEQLNPLISMITDTSGWFVKEGDRAKWVEEAKAQSKAREAMTLSPVREKVIPEIMKYQGGLQHADLMANLHQDIILQEFVRRAVETDSYLRKKWDISDVSEDVKWNEKIKTQEYLLKIFSRASEELCPNLDDVAAGKLTIGPSGKGRGVYNVPDERAYFDPATQKKSNTTKAFMDEYPEFYSYMNDGASPGALTGRPEMAYWSLLKNHPELQKMLVWGKHQEAARAMELKEANVWDFMDIMTSMAEGYMHRTYAKDPRERWKSAANNARRDQENFELHSKSADFSDFVARCKEKGLVPVERYDILSSKYQGDAFSKLSFSNLIRTLLSVGHPEDGRFSVVAYVNSWYLNGKKVAKGTPDAIQLTYDMLRDLNMVEMKNAPELVARQGDLWSAPYVHRSFADVIENVYMGNRPSEQTKAFLKLVGWNKRFIMYTPTIFAFQATSSAVVNLPPWQVPGAIAKSLWAAYPFAPYIRSFESMKGKAGELGRKYNKVAEQTMVGVAMKSRTTIGEGLNTLLTNLRELDVTKGTMERMVKSGFSPLRARIVLDTLYDSGIGGEHPGMKNNWQNAVHFWFSKFGLDEWAFEKYLAKASMDCWEAKSKYFQKKYKISENEADILSSHWINDLIGQYERGTFGSEGPLLQWLMFARNFTVSEFRNLTGMYHWGRNIGVGKFRPLKKLPYDIHFKMAYQGEWGNIPFVSWMLNSLWHKELSSRQMEMLAPAYASQAAKAIVWRLILVNLFQLAQGQGLSIDNEEDKKFMTKTSSKDENGRPLYIEWHYFREAGQYTSMIPRVGPLGGWSGGLGRELTSKMGVLPRIVAGIISGYDAIGRPVTGGEEVPFEQRQSDRLEYLWDSVTPEPLKVGVKTDLTRNILQTLLPIRFSYGTAAGHVTPEEIKGYREVLAKERYRQFQVQKLQRKFDLDHPIWQIAIEEGVLTNEQYINLMRKQVTPERQLRKQTKTYKRRQDLTPPPWAQ